MVILVVLLNGFFVLAEYSLVRVRSSRLEEMEQHGEGTASIVLRISKKRETYLSAIQVGITASSVLLGILGGPLFARILAADGFMDKSLAWACSFLMVIFLHVVFGELVPRAVAVSKVEKVVLLVSYPLVLVHYLLYPLVLLFNKVARIVLGALGISQLPKEDISRSEDELRKIVSASEQHGQLDHAESRMIDNVFDFADRVAREVMVPRQDMVCLYTDDSLEDNLQVVRNGKHTRYPLCDEDKDHVIGIVHVQDLIDLDSRSADFDFRQIMRPISVVPEAMSTVKVLQMLQQKHQQMALVADEYGGTAGLVTVEDLVEEIVGEIQDEHEADEPDDIVKLSEKEYEFDGLVLLDEITDILGVSFDDPEEDTIGGYIFGLLGRKPEVGDSVEIGCYDFTVLQAEGFRVLRVRAVRVRDDEDAGQDEQHQ